MSKIQPHISYKWCRESKKLERYHKDNTMYHPNRDFREFTHLEIEHFVLENK